MTHEKQMSREKTSGGLLRVTTTLSFVGILFSILFLMPHEVLADLYFNSSEPGCSGSDPNVLWCDDFEDGDWAHTYANANDVNNDGWVMTPYSPGCGSGCPTGSALIGSPTNGALCGNAGAAGTNCTASSGQHSGTGQAAFMGDHNFSGLQSVNEIYFRYYLKDLPGFQSGLEKMLSINLCCAGGGGIKFGNTFSWSGTRNIQVTVEAEQVNRGLNVSSISLLAGNWWYIEYHIKLNTPGVSDGIWEAWIDNCGPNGTGCTGTPTLRARHTNVVWRNSGDSSQIGSLWMENWANPGSVGETYYDQIKVSRVGPIGFLGQGTASNPPPAPPTNLRIQ